MSARLLQDSKKLHIFFFLLIAVAANAIVAMNKEAVGNQLRFMHAVTTGDILLLQNVIDKSGVDVNAANKSNRKFPGEAPLMIAIKQGSVVVANALLQAKAAVNVVDTYTGKSPLYVAVAQALYIKADSDERCQQQLKHAWQSVDLLLSHGADFAVTLKANKKTLFHLCADRITDAKHSYPRSQVPDGKVVLRQLVRSICLAQGGLYQVVCEEDVKKKADAQTKFDQIITKLREILQQKDGTGRTVADVFCEKWFDCKNGEHCGNCPAKITLLDWVYIERMKFDIKHDV